MPPAPKIEKPIEIHVPYPSSQTHIWVGRAGLARLDPDYFPLYLGNHVLGGGGFIFAAVQGGTREAWPVL